jgi:hypothetical protein
MSCDGIPEAIEAIAYVLDRAGREPASLGRHLEPMTEAWALLVRAEAKLLGADLVAHRNWRDAKYQADVVMRPESKSGVDERDAAGVALAVAEAWCAHVGGDRADLLVPTQDGPRSVEVVSRAGAWVVIKFASGAMSLTHGPTGRAAVRATGDDAAAALIGHLGALATAGGGVLDGTDLPNAGRVLRERGAIP